MIYVTHCRSLCDRKKFMREQFFKDDISAFEFYEDFDACDLDDDIINKYYSECPLGHFEKHKLWEPNNIYRKLNLIDISLVIKHIEVYKKIAEGNDEFGIIFEDDSVLCDNFTNRFEECLSQTPKDFDMISFGSGCNLHAELVPNKLVYRKYHPATRCTCALVVTKKCCQDLLKTIIPFHMAIDWELNWQLYFHNHIVYWWEPPLVEQGSEIGLFRSSAR